MTTAPVPAPAKTANPFAAAKIHLSLHHPFFATLAFHLVAVPKPAAWFMAHGAPAPTAAVDGKRIYYFPPFVEKLTPRQRIGLLCHEILHAALGHLWRRGNRDAPLWKVATDFAVNSTILRTTVRKKRGPNDYVEEPAFELPPNGLHERRFEGMGAEQIYAILKQEVEEHRKDCPQCRQQQACKDGQPQHGHEPMDGQLEHAIPDEEEQKEKAKRRQERREKRKQEAEERKKQAAAQAGKKEEQGEDGQGEAGAKGEKPEPGDEPKDEKNGQGKGDQKQDESGEEEKEEKDDGEGEGESGEDEGEENESDEAGDDGESDAGDESDEDGSEAPQAGGASGGGPKEQPAPHQQPEGEGGDWDADEGDLDDIEDTDEALADHWRGLLNQAALVAKARGNLPADLERLVKDVAEPKVPWQEVVSHWTNEILRDDYDMQVSDRRFIQHGIYLPDLHSDARSILVVIDVSGSIGEKELAAFVGEVTGILRCQGVAQVRLMACDAAVTFDQTFGPSDDLPEKFPGGGGTDFRPPFKRLQDGDGDFRPAGVIYLTDMCGTFPSEDPGFPTIWLASCPPFMDKARMPQAPFGLTISYDPLTDAEPELHVVA